MKSNRSLQSENTRQDKALVRHSAVSWIEQAKTSGHSFGDALVLASHLPWGDRFYSPRTLEGWYYEHKKKGFEALVPKVRSDKGQPRALSPQAQEAIITLRKEHPGMQVTVLVEHLEKEGILEQGVDHLACVYRLLKAHGLDRQRLRAQAQNANPHAPTKAFELPHANALWMADVMYGPTLSVPNAHTGKTNAVHTYLIGFIDDCSRLVPHAQYYPEQGLRPLLDSLREACRRRGIPEKLYTDNGKIFLSGYFKVVCANLGIRLIHAKPYAAWSKGKIERFFLTVQQQFQASLAFNPLHSIQELNERFFTWLESQYHQRKHGALHGQSPAQRFAERILSVRTLPDHAESLFLARVERRVRTDATITVDGTFWEVPVHLKGCRVEVHYDPFGINEKEHAAEIWYQGQLAGVARPLDKNLNSKTYNSQDYERRKPGEEEAK